MARLCPFTNGDLMRDVARRMARFEHSGLTLLMQGATCRGMPCLNASSTHGALCSLASITSVDVDVQGGAKQCRVSASVFRAGRASG